jgi:hypothetical protein
VLRAWGLGRARTERDRRAGLAPLRCRRGGGGGGRGAERRERRVKGGGARRAGGGGCGGLGAEKPELAAGDRDRVG